MSDSPALAVAQRYAAAMAAGADDGMRAICDPAARIWHNTDDVVQTLDENLRLGGWLRKKVPDLEFADVRHVATSDGFVQRHRMRGTFPDGNAFDVPSCLVVTLSGTGLIAAVEEYIDSAGMAGLRAATGPSRGSG